MACIYSSHLSCREILSSLRKYLFAGNHYGKRRMGRVVENMPWASVTRRPWVRTTLWYRLFFSREEKEVTSQITVSYNSPEYNNPFSPRMQLGFTRGFPEIGKPSLFAWHVARTEDTIQLERSCKKMEGIKKKKNQGRMDREKNPQTPMVSKVAQQAEHYALSNSKCCWQAGWLLAGEGLFASLPQIQTSHTVDICNGTTDNTAALQSHRRPDRTAHHPQ